MPLDPSLVAGMTEAPSTDKLLEVAEMGRQLEVELLIVFELELAIEESRRKIAMLQDLKLPDLMRSVGLEEIKLSSGTKVTLQPIYSASLPSEPIKRSEALDWLRKNDHGSLIKTNVSIKYGMGEEPEVEKLVTILEENEIAFESKEDVHFKTLQSFVKGQYEAGKTFPEALFNAFTKTVAQIKQAKK